MDLENIVVSDDQSLFADDFEYIDQFLEDCRIVGYSAGTLTSHGSNLRVMARHLHSKGISILSLDKKNLRSILVYLTDTRGVGSKSCNNYFSACARARTHKESCLQQKVVLRCCFLDSLVLFPSIPDMSILIRVFRTILLLGLNHFLYIGFHIS